MSSPPLAHVLEHVARARQAEFDDLDLARSRAQRGAEMLALQTSHQHLTGETVPLAQVAMVLAAASLPGRGASETEPGEPSNKPATGFRRLIDWESRLNDRTSQRIEKRRLNAKAYQSTKALAAQQTRRLWVVGAGVAMMAIGGALYQWGVKLGEASFHHMLDLYAQAGPAKEHAQHSAVWWDSMLRFIMQAQQARQTEMIAFTVAFTGLALSTCWLMDWWLDRPARPSAAQWALWQQSEKAKHAFGQFERSPIPVLQRDARHLDRLTQRDGLLKTRVAAAQGTPRG